VSTISWWACARRACTFGAASRRAAGAARERLEKSLAKAQENGSSVAGTTSVVTDPAALAGCEFVVEAVPELVEVKHAVLATIAEAAADAAIGTNTSSLSVDRLADVLPEPARLVGLHFFNPVPVSDLVEVVVGARTDPTLVQRAQQWVAPWARPPSR